MGLARRSPAQSDRYAKMTSAKSVHARTLGFARVITVRVGLRALTLMGRRN